MRPKINDDKLVEAVEEAAFEHGSKSEAIRYAIRQQFVDESDEKDSEKIRINDHLSPKLKKAHRILWELQHGDKINMGAALSVLSQEMGVDKDTCKHMYVSKLDNENMLEVISGMESVWVGVRDPNLTLSKITKEEEIEQ